MNAPQNKLQEQAAKTETDKARRILAFSLLLSVVIAWMGILGVWQIGQQANRIDHALYHAKEGLTDLQHYAEQTKDGKR